MNALSSVAAALVSVSFTLCACREGSTALAQTADADTPRFSASAADAADPQGGPEILRLNSKGDFAEVLWSGVGEAGFVTVRRSTAPGGEPIVVLFYSVFGPNRPSEGGRGEIPATDFEGSWAQGTLRLSTNTSAEANPGFTRFRGSGGMISIEWHKTDGFRTHRTGTFQLHSDAVRRYSSGEETASSADAQGTVVGFTVGTVKPVEDMGTSHGVQMTIQPGR